MPLRITNLRSPIDEPESVLPGRLARALGIPPGDLQPCAGVAQEPRYARQTRCAIRLFDRSAGSGRRGRAATFPRSNTSGALRRAAVRDAAPRRISAASSAGRRRLRPGGLVAAYFLAEHGYRPLVLERGRAVRERIRDVQRLRRRRRRSIRRATTSSAKAAPARSATASSPAAAPARTCAACWSCSPSARGSRRSCTTIARTSAAIGLPAVVKAMRQRIEALGGEVRFHCRVEDLDLADGTLRGVATSSGYIPATSWCWPSATAPATPMRCWRSAACRWCKSRFRSACASSIRRRLVNRVQYGPTPLEERLGAADYSLVAHGQNDLFTFCMCAGGYVIPSVSEAGYFCTNGMSLSKRDSPLRQQRPGRHGPGSSLRRRRRAGRRALAAAVRGESASSWAAASYLCPVQRAAIS